MVASADDLESLCKIVNGNLKETYADSSGKIIELKHLSTSDFSVFIVEDVAIHMRIESDVLRLMNLL